MYDVIYEAESAFVISIITICNYNIQVKIDWETHIGVSFLG